MTIQEQAKKTLHEVGIPISVFCRKMQISQTAYYRWLSGDLRLSADNESKIRKFIYKLSEVF